MTSRAWRGQTPRRVVPHAVGLLASCVLGGVAVADHQPPGPPSEPVISNQIVLLNDGDTLVRNLRDRGIISGTEPLTILAAQDLSSSGTQIVITQDVCLSITFDNDGSGTDSDGDGLTEHTVEITVANLARPDGVTGQFRIEQGAGGNDTACVSTGDPPVARAHPTNQTYSAVILESAGTSTASVLLDGSGSSDDNEPLASWNWTIAGVTVGSTETATVNLPVGTHPVQLTVVDRDGGVADSDSSSITVTLDRIPDADAGPNAAFPDLNADGTETVTLDGSGSSDDGTIATYQWLDENGGVIGNAARIDVPLAVRNGQPYTFTLRVTDDSGQSAEDTVEIQVVSDTDVDNPPDANAGPDQIVEDTDLDGSVVVTLDGSGSTDDGTIVAYEWLDENENIVGTTAVVNLTLSVRATPYTFMLVVRDDAESPQESEPDEVRITVRSPTDSGPVANAGPDQTLVDEDGDGSEVVQLDGSQSSDDRGIVSYTWEQNGEVIAEGAAPQVTLAVGTHVITLRVEDDQGAADTDSVTVQVQERAQEGRVLSDMSGLSQNQRSMATLIDDLCPRLADRAADPNVQTPPDEAQLLALCTGLKSEGTTESQVKAGLDAMSGDEIGAQQTTAIDYSQAQLSNIGARIVALRRGTGGGVSVAGLNIYDDGRALPVGALAAFLEEAIGGGASGDAEEDGGLLGRRLGIFINGNIIRGEKDESLNEAAFDFDGWGITLGLDYRFTDHFVLGAAVGYNESDSGFAEGGGLNGESTTGSIYGTYFTDNLYFDFVGSSASVDYNSARRIVYSDITGLRDFTAEGATDGDVTAFGASFGYDFHRGGWSFGPTLAVDSIDVTVDPFAETGAGGLNLAFGEQNAKSKTVEGGFRFSYAWSRDWGVLTPYMRLAFVKETENDSQVIHVRFVNDPFVNDPSQPTPGLTIITDEPDEEYMRWGVGFSAVLGNGVSAFVDYDTYSGLRHISSHELSFGVRFERGFR